MKNSPITLRAGTPAIEAARLMAKEGVGLIVITDPKDSRRVTAVISERDIIKAIATGTNLDSASEQIGTRSVIKTPTGTRISVVAKLMHQQKIRHMVIVDNKENLVGVISMRDLVGEQSTLDSLESQDREAIAATD